VAFYPSFRSGRFDDPARFDTVGAHFKTGVATFYNSMNFLKIWLPPAAGTIVGVTDMVPVNRTFTADITTLSHDKTSET